MPILWSTSSSKVCSVVFNVHGMLGRRGWEVGGTGGRGEGGSCLQRSQNGGRTGGRRRYVMELIPFETKMIGNCSLGI